MENSVLRYVNMAVKIVIIEMVALHKTKPWVYKTKLIDIKIFFIYFTCKVTIQFLTWHAFNSLADLNYIPHAYI